MLIQNPIYLDFNATRARGRYWPCFPPRCGKDPLHGRLGKAIWGGEH